MRPVGILDPRKQTWVACTKAVLIRVRTKLHTAEYVFPCFLQSINASWASFPTTTTRGTSGLHKHCCTTGSEALRYTTCGLPRCPRRGILAPPVPTTGLYYKPTTGVLAKDDQPLPAALFERDDFTIGNLTFHSWFLTRRTGLETAK